MSIQIYDVDCPSCGVKCWINNGDTDDFTVQDVEAARCWSCNREFVLDGTLSVADSYPSRAHAIDGVKTSIDHNLRMDLLTALIEASNYDELYKRAMELLDFYDPKRTGNSK